LADARDDEQQAFFSKHYWEHGTRCVFYWLWDGTAALCGVNFPGSRNDGYVEQSLHVQERMAHLDPKFTFVSDSGFEGNDRILRGLTDLDVDYMTPEDREAYETRSVIFHRLRSSAEWGNSSLLNAFRILRDPARDVNDSEITQEICVRLFNVRVRCMQIGQLHTVMQRYKN